MNSEPKKVSLGSAIIFGAATLLAGLAIGFNWDYITTNWFPYIGINIQATADWSELNEVYNALEKDYDGEIDLAKLKEGAKKGLVAAVGDQYTTYMTKEEAEEFKDSLHGNVGNGIGGIALADSLQLNIADFGRRKRTKGNFAHFHALFGRRAVFRKLFMGRDPVWHHEKQIRLKGLFSGTSCVKMTEMRRVKTAAVQDDSHFVFPRW